MSKQRHHTKKYLKYQSDLFCRLQKKSEVLELLKVSPKQFQALTENPKYNSFMVGKKSGGERHIENPSYELKAVQDRLNQQLQAVYYFHKTPLAHAYIISTSNEKDKRNILENARKHIGKPYLLNIDLKDFFHTIEVPRLWKVFGSAPFRFQHDAAKSLTRLVTYHNRLPMGSPTSPVLSNLAMIPLDNALLKFAEPQQMTVTRFADDISFSSAQEITTEHLETIKNLIVQEGFVLNEEKVKFFRPEDIKEVTGIQVLEDKVDLPANFIPELESEIAQLEAILLVQNQQGKLNTQWVETFKKHLQGKINFLGYITGSNSAEKQRLAALLEKASQPPPEEFGSYSWRSFHYHI